MTCPEILLFLGHYCLEHSKQFSDKYYSDTLLQALFVFPLFTSLPLHETAAKQYFLTNFNRKMFSKNFF